MSVWDDLPGQGKTITALSRAVAEGSPSHAWLFTGPPGSGRTNAARAFAAALQCTAPDAADRGCGQCKACVTVLAGTHPDVALISTEKVNYQIEDVRELITKAQDRPSTAPWRVIIVEDADRMTERTTNVLLKSIEEPPAHHLDPVRTVPRRRTGDDPFALPFGVPFGAHPGRGCRTAGPP